MPQPLFKDPDFVHQNRLPVNAVGFGYDTVGDARDSIISSHYVCLDAQWDFLLFDSVEQVPEGIELVKDFSAAQKAAVPSDRQMSQLESFDLEVIEQPQDRLDNDNTVGVFHRTIEITTTMLERELFLQFDGVGSCAEVYLNGCYIGFCQSSYDGHRFNIADFATLGTNHLSVIVYRFSYGSCFEDDGLVRLCGIFRSVWLCGEPIFRIENAAISTKLIDNNKVGRLYVSAQAVASAELESMELWGVLYNANGAIVAKGQEIVLDIVRTENLISLELKMEVSEVHPWSDESPYLYRLVLYLQDTYGNTLDLRSTHVGFRDIVVRKTTNGDTQLLMNGRPLKLFGIGHTEWNSENGRVTDKEDLERTLYLLKRCNINAISLSQPAGDQFYDMCDRLGILIVSQLKMAPDKKILTKKQLTEFCSERANSMYRRLKNHPCIVMWSLNDVPPEVSGTLNRLINSCDDTRPIEGYTVKAVNAFSAKTMRKHAKVNSMPLVFRSIAGTTTNSLSNIKEYAILLRRQDSFVGIFVHNYRELAIFDGEEYRIFEDGGILKSDCSPYPVAFEIKQCYSSVEISFDGAMVTVYNRNYDQPLQRHYIGWELRLDGLARQTDRIELPKIAPGDSYSVKIPYNPINTDKAIDLVVNVTDSQRFEWSDPDRNVSFGYTRLKERSDLPPCGNVLPQENDECFVMERNGTRFEVNKTSGFLSGISIDNFEYLLTPLMPQICRAEVDNDRCEGLSERQKNFLRVGFWNQAQESIILKRIRIVNDLIVSTFVADGMKKLEVSYGCTHEGELQIRFVALPTYGVQRLGLTFSAVEDMTGMAIFGLGPGENYIDRKEAAMPVLLHGNAGELCTSYSRPQDNGNRHGTEWLMLVGKSNNRSKMMLVRSSDRPIDVSVQPYSRQELIKATPQEPPKISDSMTVNLDAVNAGIGEQLQSAVYMKNPNCAPVDTYTMNLNIQITSK